MQQSIPSIAGRFLQLAPRLHRCKTPRDDANTYSAGDLWECTCGARWRFISNYAATEWVRT